MQGTQGNFMMNVNDNILTESQNLVFNNETVILAASLTAFVGQMMLILAGK